MILYGIPTCDTCKKALRAIEYADKVVAFRDVRADPLTEAELQEFLSEFGDRLVNRTSPTWRGMSDWLKASEADAQIKAHPTLMKRPVIRHEGRLYLGWGEDVQKALLG